MGGCFVLSSSNVLLRKFVFKASGGCFLVPSSIFLFWKCVFKEAGGCFLVSSWLTHYSPVFKKIFLQSGFFLFFVFELKSASDSSLCNYLKHSENNNNFFDKSIYLGLAWSYLSWPRDNLFLTKWIRHCVYSYFDITSMVIISCFIVSYDIRLPHCAFMQLSFIQFSILCYESYYFIKNNVLAFNIFLGVTMKTVAFES